MNRNDKRAPEDMEEDDDGESHAADEPTAVWDEKALRAAGLNSLFDQRKSDPPPPPATPAHAADRPSIEVSADVALALATGQPADPPMPPPAEPQQVLASTPPPGLGWGTTLTLAVALGALVYALIRYIKG